MSLNITITPEEMRAEVVRVLTELSLLFAGVDMPQDACAKLLSSIGEFNRIKDLLIGLSCRGENRSWVGDLISIVTTADEAMQVGVESGAGKRFYLDALQSAHEDLDTLAEAWAADAPPRLEVVPDLPEPEVASVLH